MYHLNKWNLRLLIFSVASLLQTSTNVDRPDQNRIVKMFDYELFLDIVDQ